MHRNNYVHVHVASIHGGEWGIEEKGERVGKSGEERGRECMGYCRYRFLVQASIKVV